SNAVYTIESMFIWNVLPPCVATLVAIGFVTTISPMMAAVLTVVGGIVVFAMFRLAAAGGAGARALPRNAGGGRGARSRVGCNTPLVRAFCRLGHEHRRFDRAVHHEMRARSHSLLYLERVRILHALVTVVLTIGLLAWAIALWQRGEITTGDVVLACTLGLSV